MTNAKRDNNRVPAIIGVSSSDGTTITPVYVDPTTHRLLVDGVGTTGATGPTGTGVTGPTGPASTVPGPTGPTGLNWQGAWSGTTSYNLNDAVSIAGSSYISITGSNLNNQPPNATAWNLLSQIGATGPTGADSTVPGPTGPTGVGPTGPTGPTGANSTVAGPTGPTGPSGSATPRVVSTTSSGTITIDSDATDLFELTNQIVTGAFQAPAGSPVNGQKLLIRIVSTGSANALTFATGASGFIAQGQSFPTTTVANKTTTVGFMFDTANSLNKWGCLLNLTEV